jgi:phosphatidylglycerophosphate synthase
VVQLRVKKKDAWWTVVVVDPVAAPLLRALYQAPQVTPNRLTVASLTVAIAAGFSYASGTLVLGALLFQLSFLLDCMDGKLAHSRDQLSRFGGWFDSVIDGFRVVFCYGGLVWSFADDDLSRATTAVIALYPVLSYTVIVTGKAWPDRPPSEALSLNASTISFVRASPRRAGSPASGVDAEAAVFTLGPLLAEPVIGIWVGAGLNLVHLLGTAPVRTVRALSVERRATTREASSEAGIEGRLTSK